MTQYRLLRNNKESGPYSKEQLVQMGLKAYDLVWADGKSAAWRYPSEINELKDFAPVVEDQPFDRFYKRKENKVEQPVETVATLKKEKPRFRIKADTRKIEPVAVYENTITVSREPETNRKAEPVKNFVADSIKSAAVAPPWESIYSEWKTKNAVPKTAKTPALPLEDEPVIETKYSQSLNEIKERYVETILKPRQEQKGLKIKISKRYALLAILLPMLAFGMWYSYNKKEPNEIAGKVVQAPTEQKQEGSVALDDNKETVPSTTEEETTQQTADNKAANEIVADKASNNLPVQEQKISNINTVINKPETDDAKPVNLFNTTFNGKDGKAENKIIPANNNPVINTPVTTVNTNSPKDYEPQQPIGARTVENRDNSTSLPLVAQRKITRKKIEDYVLVNNTYKPHGSSIQNIRLSVENITDYPIDLAVLDVQYFDANGRYQKGETVYVKNIPANNNVLVRVPDSRNSYSINYKVSMISAEQSTLYLIAD